MFNLFKRFFDYNERHINRLKKKVDEINLLEDRARKLKDSDFKKETASLRKDIQSEKKTLDEILPWSFALVREAARRVLGERHFDVQLLAGVALHEGKVIEQKTGEGKTLSATTALYLNALTDKGVHLVTVNDYLARRDCGWMGAVFNFLGLKTSAIISDQSYIYDQDHKDNEAQDWRLIHLRPVSRREAYLADITYGINSEFGFDYLRDNMAQNQEEIVQRGFYYAVIDEADSVLIDEARTPHIISAPYDEDVSKYYKYAGVVRRLDQKSDYLIDEKSRTANLTESGIKKIESMIGVENIYEKDFDSLYHIEAALKAATLFKKDKDYIVKDGEIIIVDEFTGRLLYGRRFSEGIHQAIEAKENVNIQKESKTLATVSLQNYFRLYKKLAGMTGTAATEAEELHKIYKTEVLVAPTNRPMVRADRPDMIYKTETAKFNAVAAEVAENYRHGRPVLVGTTSIEKNELLSDILRKKGIPHELLNAKQHEREAMILAQAGKKGAVTVATNMAGRGVDIILGGAPPNRYLLGNKETEYKKEKEKWQKEHDEVVKLGGLYVIGTERHESRRIDNQLRGRAGRQGDPGETRFFVSLEDDLMRIFGGDQITKMMNFLNFPEDQPISHGMVSRAIEQAQVKVEGFNFDIRKHLVDFDDVLNRQREIVYGRRRKILALGSRDGEEFRGMIFEMFKEEFSSLSNSFLLVDQEKKEEDWSKFAQEINLILPVDQNSAKKYWERGDLIGLNNFLQSELEEQYLKKEKKLGKNLWSEVVKMLFLATFDKYWTDHLTAIENLREGINLRGYAQLDPLVEYKNEAFSMFENLLSDIDFEITRRIMKINVEESPGTIEEKKIQSPVVYKSASSIDPFHDKKQSPSPNQFTTSSDTSSPRNKLGRNDPCWCGSGKKWKKCHYPQLA
ncbi:preprotein translocase subunit SecA [Candidatus Roizmanbacteria bacterium]|nr:preprotein translocase subunit SecA [Candidatus Roizmanbacteria bacterium]